MRVLLLSPALRDERPDTDLSSVIADLLEALHAPGGWDVVLEPAWDLSAIDRALRAHRPDVVFNACETLEGRSDYEPLVPQLLERRRVAFTGSGSRCLQQCLSKRQAASVLRAAGIRVPRSYAPGDVPADAYPVIVKPDAEDGSVGIHRDSVAFDEAGLRRALAALEAEGRSVTVEQFVDGREIAVALLGWPEPRVLPPGEILYDAAAFEGRARILTYASKWDASSADYAATPAVSASLPPELLELLSFVAVRAADALGMRDYGRIDFRVDAGGEAFVIDANPNCDLSTGGGFMRAAARVGLSYADTVGTILAGAIARVR